MESSGGGAGAAIFGTVFMLIWVAIAVVVIAGMWKTYSKAGKPGWGCFIPIYNIVLLLQIAGKPVWWLILICIPVVNCVVWIIMLAGVAKAFGKDVGFAIGLLFLPFIFYPILGFGSAQYMGAEGEAVLEEAVPEEV